MRSTPLGPWPEGLDNVHDADSKFFQARKGATPRLTVAENVDLDDTGWPSIRPGTVDRRTGTAYSALTSFGSYLYVQDGTSILRIDPSTYAATSIATSLAGTATFHPFAGELYWTDGTNVGKITEAGAPTHWGFTNPPSPTLGATTGSLGAATYRVVCTLENANGLESGAPKASEIAASGGITVNLTSLDSNATHVNIYVGRGDHVDLFWSQKVAVGDLPATISTLPTSDRFVRTQYLRGPIAGSALFSYLGYMMIARDNVVFRSRGQVPHLFHPRSEIMTFPGAVRAGAGLKDGFYVATATGLNWVTGSTPAKWSNTAKDDVPYTSAVLKTSGKDFPSLRTEDDVVFFGSDVGLVAGLPGGEVRYITDHRLSLPSGNTTGGFALRRAGGIKHLLMLLD